MLGGERHTGLVVTDADAHFQRPKIGIQFQLGELLFTLHHPHHAVGDRTIPSFPPPVGDPMSNRFAASCGGSFTMAPVVQSSNKAAAEGQPLVRGEHLQIARSCRAGVLLAFLPRLRAPQ